MKTINAHKGGRGIYMAVVTAFVFGLSVATFDMAINILRGPTRYDSFGYMLGPLAVTLVVGVVFYLTVWFLITSSVRKHFGVEAAPFAVSLACFWGILFMLVRMIEPSLAPNHFIILAAIVAISLLLLVGVYFTVVILDGRPKVIRVLRVLALALPFFLAETMILAWIQVYRVAAFRSMTSFVATSAYMLVALLTAGLFFRIGRDVVRERLLFALALGVVLSPVAGVVTSRQVDRSEYDFRNEDNPIKQVVLITVDTLRRNALSCYNPETASSPNVDRLAEDGIVFTRAMSPAPWTLPSVASIMTGVAPCVHLVLHYDSKLPESLPTLAEHMREAGFMTSGIGHNVLLGRDHNFDRGFREYEWYRKAMPGGSIGEAILQRFFRDRYKIDVSTEELTEVAIAWLRANADKSFFLWIHYLDPHAPYTPPEKYHPNMTKPPGVAAPFTVPGMRCVYDGMQSAAQRRWMRGLYDGEVRYVDDGIGRLLDTLEEWEFYDETLIVLTSDHGEEFWEHDGYAHGHTLYDELIWVPLIVKPPFSSVKREVATTVTTQSIMPTILDLCGVEFDKGYLAVESLVPLWKQEADSCAEKPVFSTGTGAEIRVELESVCFDGFKYIRSRMTGRDELYDLRNDPDENHSIVSHLPKRVAEARLLLDEHNERADKLRKRFGIRTERVELNEERLKRLRALGYL